MIIRENLSLYNKMAHSTSHFSCSPRKSYHSKFIFGLLETVLLMLNYCCRRRREKRSGSVVRRGESEVRRGTSSSRRGTSTSRRGDNEETATRPAGEDETDIVEEKLRISLQGQQGLGCSICKVS